ncbi:MAG: tetratricopeptide repeat protein [Dehalococcoidia bacterium]|nr:tetratricopeptide repeat protein [Dehalococcoidia bacterium]
MEWFFAFGGTILKCLSLPIKWPIERLRLIKQEKKEAEREVTLWFEKYKNSLKQQLDKETNSEKRQALEDDLKQLDAGERGYYREMLERTLERSGISAYGELVAKGELILEPDNKAKLIEAVSRLDILPPPPTADDFMASGSAKYALERYEEALADLNQALNLRPDHPDTLNDRGVTYHNLDRYDEALADYNRSLELRPDHPDTLSNRGLTYYNLKRYGEALADYNRSLELRPDDPATLNNRGVIYLRMERYVEAHADFNRTLQLKPDKPLAVYNMACLFSLTDKPNDAIYHLEKAIALDKVSLQKAITDSDFDNIRDDPRFKKLIKGD